MDRDNCNKDELCAFACGYLWGDNELARALIFNWTMRCAEAYDAGCAEACSE